MRDWAMLCKPLEESDLKRDWSDYALEPKHDGMRAVFVRNKHGKVRVYGRSGIEYTEHVPALVEEAERTLPINTIIDGELAHIKDFLVVDGANIPLVNFNRTMRVMGSNASRAVSLQEEFEFEMSYIVFDVLHWNGLSQLNNTWRTRQRILDMARGLRLATSTNMIVNPAWDKPGLQVEMYYHAFVDGGIEGVIMKNVHGTYVKGGRPTKNWYKIKHAQTFDVVVIGFTDGLGKYTGQIGAIQFGAFDAKGVLTYVGKCSGMTDEERLEWTRIRDDHDFTIPRRVIEIRANDLVGSGEFRTPRHPQYIRERMDIAPLSCSMDQFHN